MIPTGGCALANLIAGEDPIGTATPFDQLFLIQVPPPWRSIALDSPAVPAGVRQALIPALKAKQRAYVLLIDSDEPLDDVVMRVLFYHKPSGPAGPYESSEYLISRNATADLIRELSTGACLARETGLPKAKSEFEPREIVGAWRRGSPGRDLLVCTHGERDSCCGRFGEAAYQHLRRSSLAPGTRVWRVSHFGGHRFAPTLVDLPSGRIWGKLSPEALSTVANRSGPVASFRGSYRGWCALPPAAQFLERELLIQHDWSWLEARVDATVVSAEHSHQVRLDAKTQRGAAIRIEAEIVEVESVRLPLSCSANESSVSQFAFAKVPTVIENPMPANSAAHVGR